MEYTNAKRIAKLGEILKKTSTGEYMVMQTVFEMQKERPPKELMQRGNTIQTYQALHLIKAYVDNQLCFRTAYENR